MTECLLSPNELGVEKEADQGEAKDGEEETLRLACVSMSIVRNVRLAMSIPETHP